ncbi:hypothetical protein [Botrimarina sp.]|uniref:hypothetical protein n=1 Tax=Botrimarina sp. TaxID=2795802 RepID=UPI0032EFB7AA
MTLPHATRRDAAFGYLLVVDDAALGYTGGLLVVCDRGRPLEFHCTEPVQPSHAQQILYGPTLKDYLCGELIGGALLAKAKLPIAWLFATDDATAAAGRSAGVPTLVLTPDAPHPAGDSPLAKLAQSIDPLEPFGRVRDAIREAQRLGAEGDELVAA